MMQQGTRAGSRTAAGDRGQPRPGRRFQRPRLAAVLCLLTLTAGCAAHRANIEKKLMAEYSPVEHAQAVADAYRVACPDVLEVIVAGRPDLSARLAVGPDG